jgi:hypothetical protein
MTRSSSTPRWAFQSEPASSNGACWMPVEMMCFPAGATVSSCTLWITNSIGKSSAIRPAACASPG